MLSQKYNIIDCTLRDGGFTNDFNWSIKFSNNYLSLINKTDVKFIEIGYWKQKNKSKNIYYNIDEDIAYKFKNKTNKKLVVISDFHYSSKQVKEYPTKKDKSISLIRITSRIEDLSECIEFINDLKNYTKLQVSLNLFNFSNYQISDLLILKKNIRKSNADFIYIADTHGNIDFYNSDKKKIDFLNFLKSLNKNIGFHFHDNIGTAFSNFKFCINKGFNYFDSTIFGIGRGGGNLRTEYIVKKKYKHHMTSFITNFKNNLIIDYNLYCFVTGLHSVSNLYAKYAYTQNIDINKFENFCSKLNLYKKNNFNLETISSL